MTWTVLAAAPFVVVAPALLPAATAALPDEVACVMAVASVLKSFARFPEASDVSAAPPVDSMY